jgi:hypothetical protein
MFLQPEFVSNDIGGFWTCREKEISTMENNKDGQKKRRGWAAFSAAVLLTILGMIYLNSYYHADSQALSEFTTENPVEVQVLTENATAYLPEEAIAGLVFYPGGKVEHTAYEPLMKSLASEGILCILLQMPFRLAVLDMDAAAVREKLSKMTVETMTPIEAMNALYELKRMLQQ